MWPKSGTEGRMVIAQRPLWDPLTVRVGCEFQHQLDAAVPAIVLVRPAGSRDAEILRERWTMTPPGGYHDYVDGFGNVCRRLTFPPGYSTLSYEADVVVPGEPDPVDFNVSQALVEDLPDEVLVYTLPSRFCLSDELTTEAWSRFGYTTPGWARVQAICDYVNSFITFGYGLSYPTKTSRDVLATGNGVCRDFAHLAIAFVRAMNIPARYTFGYIPDIDVPPPYSEMDFCAWFEAYLGGRWWTFDPRNNTRRRGRIAIARGRDALDVAMITTFGYAPLASMRVIADELPA
jgi:transglutaminase-like putative cysteine protease